MMLGLLLVSVATGNVAQWLTQVTIRSDGFFPSTGGVTVDEANEQGADLLREHGALRIDNLIDASTASYLTKLADRVAPRDEKPYARRHLNVPVPVEEDSGVEPALFEAFGNIFPMLSELVSLDALLVELAVMVNDPGADYQKWHADTIHQEGSAVLYSFFVAIDNITSDMGPTVLVPSSHREEQRNQCLQELRKSKQGYCDKWIDGQPRLGATLRPGDAIVFNSLLQHCASMNSSNKRRRIFYFSLSSPGRIPPGSTHTLNPAYKAAKLRLKDYKQWSSVPFAGASSNSPEL
ncbi:hypothetical protein DIPPA_18288 [Diplonema papillatum]|nr:hypothetical protein DIPPA_18288 [Diplonema papillatum]